MTQLEANFSSLDWIKEGTYLREYLEVQETHFTKAAGAGGKVYIGGDGLDFSANMGHVKTLIQVSKYSFVKDTKELTGTTIQSLKEETKPDGSLLDDGKLDSLFAVMFENWVVSTHQIALQPSERYPQKALGRVNLPLIVCIKCISIVIFHKEKLLTQIVRFIHQDSATFDSYLYNFTFYGNGMAYASDVVFEDANPPQVIP